MKKLIKLAGIIAIVVVIGFLFIACDDANNEDLDVTTWRATQDGVVIVLSFSGSDVTINRTYNSNTRISRGTYSISGSTVTLTVLGETMTGTLSGNRLTIEGVTYTKQ